MTDSGETPEGWSSLPFEIAAKRVKSLGGKIPAADYKPKGVIPVVDQGQRLVVGYTDNLVARFQGPLPVVIFGDHTRNVKYVDFDFAAGADGTIILKPIDAIDAKFFSYWLQNLPLHNLGYSRHFKLLAEQEVRFPKMAEQRRLVARIEALTSRLEQARQARQAALAEAETVFQRALEIAFSDDATEDWAEHAADELFEIVGGQVSPLDAEFRDLPYLGPEHVEAGTGRIIGERVSVAELKMKSGKYRFTPEHVVYSKIRPALRKVCAPDYPGLCSADMYALQPNLARISREFLKFLLLAPAFSDHAVEKSDRNAMPKINQTALRAFRFRVPKPPEQARIAGLLTSLLDKHAELRRLQTETGAELAAFTPALLAKAFRGEL